MIVKYHLRLVEIIKKWHLIQIMLYTSSHYFYIIIFPQEVYDVGGHQVLVFSFLSTRMAPSDH
jgi:hypothetical protein